MSVGTRRAGGWLALVLAVTAALLALGVAGSLPPAHSAAPAVVARPDAATTGVPSRPARWHPDDGIAASVAAPVVLVPTALCTYDHEAGAYDLEPSRALQEDAAVTVDDRPTSDAPRRGPPSSALRMPCSFAAEAGAPLSRVDRAGSALKDDPFHRSVSWVVDNPAAQRFSITGGDGVQRQLYQLPGEVNGKPGVFEWIVGRSGSKPVITHQRFIPGGGVTGSPNQVP